MAEGEEEEPEQEPGEGTDMLTLRQVEGLTGLSRSRLLKMIAAGEIASEKRLSEEFGSQRYVSQAEVDRIIRARQAQAQAPKRGRGRPPKLPD